jgi:hypothetical protein
MGGAADAREEEEQAAAAAAFDEELFDPNKMWTGGSLWGDHEGWSAEELLAWGEDNDVTAWSGGGFGDRTGDGSIDEDAVTYTSELESLAYQRRYEEDPEYAAAKDKQDEGNIFENFVDDVGDFGQSVIDVATDEDVLLAAGFIGGASLLTGGGVLAGTSTATGASGAGAIETAVASGTAGSTAVGTGAGSVTAGAVAAETAASSSWIDDLYGDLTGGGDDGESDWLTDLFGEGVGSIADDLLNFGLDQYSVEEQKDLIEWGFEVQNPWYGDEEIMDSVQSDFLGLLEDPSSITETPGYEFTLDAGLEALDRKHAATGDRLGGRALTETVEYAEGLAYDVYNDEMNRYAALSGADQTISGGTETAEDLAALTDAQFSSIGYNLDNIFSSY